MPKENPGYHDIGGDAPGMTKIGVDFGEDIEVARAGYDVCYDFEKSMPGMPPSVLKKGFRSGGLE